MSRQNNVEISALTLLMWLQPAGNTTQATITSGEFTDNLQSLPLNEELTFLAKRRSSKSTSTPATALPAAPATSDRASKYGLSVVSFVVVVALGTLGMNVRASTLGSRALSFIEEYLSEIGSENSVGGTGTSFQLPDGKTLNRYETDTIRTPACLITLFREASKKASRVCVVYIGDKSNNSLTECLQAFLPRGMSVVTISDFNSKRLRGMNTALQSALAYLHQRSDTQTFFLFGAGKGSLLATKYMSANYPRVDGVILDDPYVSLAELTQTNASSPVSSTWISQAVQSYTTTMKSHGVRATDDLASNIKDDIPTLILNRDDDSSSRSKTFFRNVKSAKKEFVSAASMESIDACDVAAQFVVDFTDFVPVVPVTPQPSYSSSSRF